MGEFKRFGKPRFGERDSGRSGGRRFDRPGRSFGNELHKATCAKCNKECEVPFRPTSGKPVYCSDCFRKDNNSESRNTPNLSSDKLNQINTKLDKILKALKIDQSPEGSGPV